VPVPEKPVPGSEKRVTESEKPVTESEKPVTESEKPVTEPEKLTPVGTMLQLQFQRWTSVGNGNVRLQASIYNPTSKPFATVLWNCDFYDEEKRVVGSSPIIFHNVPWGAVTFDTQYVSSDMFEDGARLAAHAAVRGRSGHRTRLIQALRSSTSSALSRIPKKLASNHKT
jgi:hypothetical protein